MPLPLPFNDTMLLWDKVLKRPINRLEKETIINNICTNDKAVEIEQTNLYLPSWLIIGFGKFSEKKKKTL